MKSVVYSWHKINYSNIEHYDYNIIAIMAIHLCPNFIATVIIGEHRRIETGGRGAPGARAPAARAMPVHAVI